LPGEALMHLMQCRELFVGMTSKGLINTAEYKIHILYEHPSIYFFFNSELNGFNICSSYGGIDAGGWL
jgi:hypothetical protein